MSKIKITLFLLSILLYVTSFSQNNYYRKANKYSSDCNIEVNKEYFMKFLHKRRIDRCYNKFHESKIKVVKYKYYEIDTIVEEWWFSKEGILDSVRYLRSSEREIDGKKYKTNLELFYFKSFYNNGLLKEEKDRNYAIFRYRENVGIVNLPNYDIVDLKYYYSWDLLTALIIHKTRAEMEDWRVSKLYYVFDSVFDNMEMKFKSKEYNVYIKDSNDVFTDTIKDNELGKHINWTLNFNKYQYIPFGNIGFRDMMLFYMNIYHAFWLYNHRWLEKGITVEYYNKTIR